MVSTPGDGSCGIGTYARDLIDGIEGVDAEMVTLPQDEQTIPNFVRVALRAARGDSDVIHVQHEYGLFRREGSRYPGVLGTLFFPLLYLLAELQSKSIVVTMHSVLNLDPDEAAFPIRVYLMLTHKLLARCSSHLIFLSPDCAADFQDHIDLAENQYNLLSHGVNTDVSPDVSRAEAKQSFGYDPEDTVIAIPGFIRPPKGHDIFIEVARRLPEYEFMIAGGARPKGEDFEFAKQVKSDAPENVTITGVLGDDEYWKALAAPDLAVLPYRVVTQSGTFNACATQELPVLASDAEYFSRIESEWGAPETVDVSDTDAVVAHIQALIEDERRRRELAGIMAQYKRANSFEQVGNDHLRIYRRLIEGNVEEVREPKASTESNQYTTASAACSAPRQVPTD
jgi:glycosyltransferase involved in cell wall biosynthesis